MYQWFTSVKYQKYIFLLWARKSPRLAGSGGREACYNRPIQRMEWAMNRIVVAGLFSLIGMPCLAFGYTQQDANEDAAYIWSSGCKDFKSGMNAGDFRGWLKPWEAAKTFSGIKSIAVNKLYMDGWDVARGLGGVVNCDEMAKHRSANYVSGVDIRRVE